MSSYERPARDPGGTGTETGFVDMEGAPAAETSGRFPPPPEAEREDESVPVTPPEEPVSEPAALPPPDPFELLARERDEYRDALVRLKADFENYKKRVFKQQDEHRDRATQSLVENLLPVLDTADLALAHGGGEDVKQIGAALSAGLEKEGLERIDPQGGPFDPTLHDAVAHEPGEGAPQEVTEVLRAGYRWKGRVIRPAMVRVRG
jgi:molecular chaperone GrpE